MKKYLERVSKGEDPEKVLNDLGITRYCCRTVLLTSVDLFDEVMQFTTVRSK